MTTRRQLLTGMLSLLAAPAIVRVSSIMPIRPFAPSWVLPGAVLDVDFVNDRVWFNGSVMRIAAWTQRLCDNELSKL